MVERAKTVKWGLSTGNKTMGNIHCPNCKRSIGHVAQFIPMEYDKQLIGEYHYLKCSKCNSRHSFSFKRFNS